MISSKVTAAFVTAKDALVWALSPSTINSILDWFEITWNKGRLYQTLIWVSLLALGFLLIQSRIPVWPAYLVLGAAFLPLAIHYRAPWRKRVKFICLSGSLLAFCVGRALFYFSPQYLDLYAFVFKFGHWGLILFGFFLVAAHAKTSWEPADEE